MKNNDVELIQGSLTGDENAFTTLVKKYQKQVHALAWRKVGDFHHAEEITQDTFLKVYHKLATLKNPHCFVGWLYRITARQCLNFQRQKQIQTQSLGDADIIQIEKMAYSQSIAEEQVKTSLEAQRDIVERLLSRLSKRQRTVITLYYFHEMTCQEIGCLLDVSANTIKSHLYRARQQLKQYELVS